MCIYGLADDRTEYQIRDRLSFMRFLGLDPEDEVPDSKTLWHYKNLLAQKGVDKKLFRRFDIYLNRRGYTAQQGQILDATLVEVPKQRNSRDENDQVKAGETPKEWKKNPAQLCQKDLDARWLQKNGKNYYGYKNHVSIDRKHRLVRRYQMTPANVHDKWKLKALLDPRNTGKSVWADAAYRSKKNEDRLRGLGYKSRVHLKGVRGKLLTEKELAVNKARSKVRALVEHVFGHQVNSLGGKFSRAIGKVRNRLRIGLMNLVYNMNRYMWLMRMHESRRYRTAMGV
jgi:IS5 family transposase